MHGWRDVYAFTKAMGKIEINSIGEDIPVTIRFSVSESTFNQSFPG